MLVGAVLLVPELVLSPSMFNGANAVLTGCLGAGALRTAALMWFLRVSGLGGGGDEAREGTYDVGLGISGVMRRIENAI